MYAQGPASKGSHFKSVSTGVDRLRFRRSADVPSTDDEALFRQLLLPWGVEPFLLPFSEDPEQIIRDALAYLKRRDWCKKGTWLVVITNALASGRVIDALQLREVE